MATGSPTLSRASSPQQGSLASNPSSPPQLRNRGGAASSSSIFVAGGFHHEGVNVSPTLSSFSSSSNVLASAGKDGSNFGAHTSKVAIRVDHSIATCFDPTDKELYDLWAPKA